MRQSVGPMTALLCHVRSEEKYRQKWTDAAKRSMMQIPLIDEVLEVTKNKIATEISTLIRLLADITLITGARQAHRFTFPMNMFVKLYNDYKIKEQRFQDLSAVAPADKPALVRDFTPPDELLEGFNVSGKGGYYWYLGMCQHRWTLEGNVNENEARQIVYHSVFGTYKEDLTILSQITDQGTWNTREDLW